MTEQNTNLSLWSSVYKTDPESTKSYKGAGGFSGTAIASLYPIQRATEIFGPLGDKWDFQIVKDEFIQGAPIINREGVNLGAVETTHSICIEMWADYNGAKIKTRAYGLTPFITQNKYGLVTDHEAQKKSLTDALKGALKLWGFSADVFMGQHDDHEYLAALKNEVSLQKADDKDAEALRQRTEYEEWRETNTRLMKESVSTSMLSGLYKQAVRKAEANNDEKYVKELALIGKARKAELAEQEKAA